MASEDIDKERDGGADHARYEFRVWGEYPKAHRKFISLSTDESFEEFEDCYLIGSDPQWNAKVRDGTLKLKRLVSRERGFDRWDSNWHTNADAVPAVFDGIFEDLSLDRPQRGKSYDISRAVDGLDEIDGPQAVFVTKRRHRYRIDSMRAEVVEMDVHHASVTLKSVAIEGDDLDDLVALRRKVGLKGLTNVAIHVALSDESLATAS